MATYKITVKNHSGAPQRYCFFNDTPVVSGGSSGDIWSNIMKASKTTPDNGQAVFEVSTEYFAICGSYDGSSELGGKITISKTVPVSLGQLSGGKTTLGSTVPLIITDKASSCDLGNAQTPGLGKIGNFQIDTAVKPGNEFTLAQAKTNKLLIGIATAQDSDLGTAMATFAPSPNVKYQIQPKAIYHVAAGEKFQVGQLVKVEMMGNSLAVDFVLRQTNEVVMIHDQTNTLSFA